MSSPSWAAAGPATSSTSSRAGAASSRMGSSERRTTNVRVQAFYYSRPVPGEADPIPMSPSAVYNSRSALLPGRSPLLMVRPAALILLCVVFPLAAQPPALVAPTDPKTPNEERSCFKLPPGFTAQLVAADPDIMKPMQIAFD